ncbi:transposase [Candidatus Oleimmundimicrobium sp.]|uniref:transposase n=1 Tax=Candidatus Oleimmundimicrobium sp. TaxID=3060597 RepID=UPI00271BE713|nr:transposase [Candidatus Oleimmundimicrobium sp.]MDO8885594.1 transposase [Candidatus Oleimmundimicrobium sp.]
MARKPRIHYQGALYHVIVRGNNRAYIFKSRENKEEYKKIASKYKKRYRFKLYAYCIMDNHAHLLIEVDDIPLSKIMQGIQQVFTQHYNRKNKTTGHVFEQRYKSYLCDKDVYLLSLIRYIHQNPVRSKLAGGINYQWSSHQEYLGNPGLTDINFPLSLFAHHKNKAIKRYLIFMDEMETKEVKSVIKEEEIIEVAKNIERHKMPKNALIKIIEEVTEIKMGKIKGNTKSKRISDIRKLYIKNLKKYTDVPNKEIADLLEIGSSTVTNVLSRRYTENDFIVKSSVEIDKNVKL